MRLAKGVALLFVALLLLAALVPLLLPVPPLEGTSSAAALAEREAIPDARFVDVDGLALFVEERAPAAASSRPPLLLLHGFLASTFTWRELLGPLAAHGRVVAFDRPAFGLSARPLPPAGARDFPPGDDPYSADAQVAQTIALMDALAIDRAVLVGSSAGGSLALRVALTRPERVRALVLLAPAVYTSGPPPWFRPLLRTPQLRRIGPLLLRSLADRADALTEAAWHDPAGVDATIARGHARALEVDDWDRALWRYTLAFAGNDDLPPRLAGLDLPILVIAGDDDRVVPTAESERLADALPNAELVVLGACGHLPHEERPQATLAAIDGFLGRLD